MLFLLPFRSTHLLVRNSLFDLLYHELQGHRLSVAIYIDIFQPFQLFMPHSDLHLARRVSP